MMMKARNSLIRTLAVLGLSTLAISLIEMAAQAETIRAPLTSQVTVSGTTGGDQSSQCGFISARPSHRLIVTEPLVSLQFSLEAGGSPTLYIQNEQGRGECVMSDNLSSGNIELPGAWEEGSYSVFVGDRNGERHSYRLSVDQGI